MRVSLRQWPTPSKGLRHRASPARTPGGLGCTFIGNVTPLSGVLYWQWDTFQLLVLYRRSRFWSLPAGLYF